LAKKLLFLTTHNLATNPRLVKEIELALQMQFSVIVLCFEFNNWSKPLNDEIKSRLISKISYHGIPGNRKPFLSWLISSLFFFLSKIFLIFFPVNSYFLSLGSNKRSWLLLEGLKKMNEKFNLVVAHNPGSFYPAQLFAERNKIPFGIDLEDYHPGESDHKKGNTLSKRLNKEVLPNADYITAASPLILKYSERDLEVSLKRKQVILNYFPLVEFCQPGNDSEKLKLVWFSQNISFGRGLEQLIPAIKNNIEIELHLFGNCNESFRNQRLTDYSNIYLHSSLPQSELHQQLSNYDIGLAIEPGKDLNNELAISNKMLAYFQSGLYILASNTKAQKRFINENPDHGMLTTLSSGDLTQTIRKLIDQKQLLRTSAIRRYENAKKYNWENESEKLTRMWEEMIH
jgi:glycosyltransferase involved in cell wall biosynthesis